MGKACIHCYEPIRMPGEFGPKDPGESYYEVAATQFKGQGHEHIRCYRVARNSQEDALRMNNGNE